MATETAPGDFILEVAKLGTQVATSFTTLLKNRAIPDCEVERLLTTISITTSILNDLGATINKYSAQTPIGDDVTRPRVEVCKADFETLLTLSKESAEKGIWMREGTLGGKPVAAEIDCWFLFRIGVGGPEESNKFFQRLDATRYSLVAISDTVKYKCLKELEKQNALDNEQTQELKSLKSRLPNLVDYIQAQVETKKKREAEEKKKGLKAIEDDKEKLADVNKPSFTRTVSNAVSEKTVFEPNQAKIVDDLYEPEPELISRRPQRVDAAVGDRRPESDYFHESHFIDTKEVFEEWTLRWYDATKQLLNYRSVFGIKWKDYNVNRAVWAKIPEIRSQEELKLAYENLSAGMPESQARASVMKTIKKLPRSAREALEELVEDRERVTTNKTFKRQWSVVAARPKPRHPFGGGGFFKTAKDVEWLIMLKGETVDRADRKQTNAWDDPWRKTEQRGRTRTRHDPYYYPDYNRRSYARPYRSPSPYPIRNRERSYSPIGRVRDYSPRPVGRKADRDYYVAQDSKVPRYHVGTIVVGNMVDVDGAETKMEEILKDLPACFTP